jgi:hypothetical protein
MKGRLIYCPLNNHIITGLIDHDSYDTLKSDKTIINRLQTRFICKRFFVLKIEKCSEINIDLIRCESKKKYHKYQRNVVSDTLMWRNMLFVEGHTFDCHYYSDQEIISFFLSKEAAYIHIHGGGISRAISKDFTGRIKLYDSENGGIKHTKKLYNQGLLDGITKYYYENGKCESKIKYKENKILWIKRYYETTGEIKEEIQYVRNGRPIFTGEKNKEYLRWWVCWNQSRKKTIEILYRNGHIRYKKNNTLLNRCKRYSIFNVNKLKIL